MRPGPTKTAAAAVIAAAILALPATVSTEEVDAPVVPSEGLTLTNGTVLSLDPGRREMVIRNNEGREETLELSDELAGFGDLEVGDDVALGVRRSAGGDRVTAITKSTATEGRERTEDSVPTGAPPESSSPAAAGPPDVDAGDAGLRLYAARVAGLAAESERVDRLWSRLRNTCNVTLVREYEAAPEWVSLWEEGARMDLTNGNCRDLYNEVVTAGETVNARMAAAAETARRDGVPPGSMRRVQRGEMMDWHGWGRTPPERQRP